MCGNHNPALVMGVVFSAVAATWAAGKVKDFIKSKSKENQK
jgi:hypothetical protein